MSQPSAHSEQELSVDQLQSELAVTKAKLQKVLSEQQESAKLLIRRDLALSRAHEKLLALDITKSEFISIAAHQLRTPLSAIKWILSMVINKEFSTEKESAEFLGKAYESCQRVINLVNDLLEVDHIESGKDQFTFFPIDPRIIVESVVFEIQHQITTRNIHFNMNLEDGVTIEADREKIRAVFQNLIENAVKYTPDGGTININSAKVGSVIKFEIQDSGIGIPENQQATVFSKFFRAKNALKADTTGSGLGLFIAKQIVLRHGGKIWFTSVEGKGTNFFVDLPLLSHSVTSENI